MFGFIDVDVLIRMLDNISIVSFGVGFLVNTDAGSVDTQSSNLLTMLASVFFIKKWKSSCSSSSFLEISSPI